MPPKIKGSHAAHSGSRAMVETIAVTDGELTALSALSGQQSSSADIEEVEETVCTTEDVEMLMDVVEEEHTTQGLECIQEMKKDVPVPTSVMLSSSNIIRGTPVFVSGASQASSASTSYVVIQSSPGNRVLTTNTTVQGKKVAQIPQIIGRVNSGPASLSPQFQTLMRTVPASGPPPLVSRSSNLTMAGIRPLNPQAVNQRGQVLTKVLLPRAAAGQQIVTLPVQDGKHLDQQRIIVGGQQVRLLSGGMKIAAIPGHLGDANKGRIESEKSSVIQATGAIANTPIRPITVVQARQMGVLSPNRIPQILPSSPGGKGLILNKVIPGSGTRVTVVPQGAKSPAKILPAPVSASPGIQSVTPQKVIIRQAPLKSVANAVPLRIPTSSQPLMATSSGLQSVQVAGRQMQYVRLVSIPSSTSSTATITSSATSKANTVLTLASAPINQSMQGNFKMIPVTSVSSPKTVVSKNVAGQKIIIPATLAMTQIKTSVPSCILSSVSLTPPVDSTASTSNIVMLSTAAAQATRNNVSLVDNQSMEVSLPLDSLVTHPVGKTMSTSSVKMTTEPVLTPVTVKPGLLNRSGLVPEPNGIRPRKPCNCTKSQCLKLYCDCFANGEFCNQCNCNCCYNNLEHEEDRQRAIRSCLERNPNAFRPKIGKGHVGDGRRHNKGCNCKRSGCLKNYCECFEAKIACSHNCKCIGCRNVEDDVDRRSLRELIEVSDVETKIIVPPLTKKKPTAQSFEIASIKDDDYQRKGARRSTSLMSDDVVNATCQCLLAQADLADKHKLNEEDAEKLIIEEFGRCLVEIISCVSNRTEDSASVSEYSV